MLSKGIFMYRIWMMLLALALGFTAVLSLWAESPNTQPAFPEAQGFGKYAQGGRGGVVLLVTNLDDSGSGSLRAAVEAEGPRTVVFNVSGTITLKSTLQVKQPYLTIAGQTAPGGGICLRVDGLSRGQVFTIETHDVIIRYLRIRPGPGPEQSEGDGITVTGHDVIIDHCSISWGTDENVDCWRSASNVTIQWCIIAEGLFHSVHGKGAHSMGVLLGDKTRAVTLYKNLIAHNNERNPRLNPTTPGIFQVIDNVIYNWGPWGGAVFSDEALVNFVGNYYKPGVNTDTGQYVLEVVDDSKVKVYPRNNITQHRTDDTMDEWAITNAPSSCRVSEPFDAPVIPTVSAQDAYHEVLAGAGANKPVRDVADTRIIKEVSNGTGKIIDHPSEVGGWPEFPLVNRPQNYDTDKDGMSDDWEKALFGSLDPDGKGDHDNDGYTDLEEFLNGLG
jgi:pectate lyase